jgi:hypothetical protein
MKTRSLSTALRSLVHAPGLKDLNFSEKQASYSHIYLLWIYILTNHSRFLFLVLLQGPLTCTRLRSMKSVSFLATIVSRVPIPAIRDWDALSTSYRISRVTRLLHSISSQLFRFDSTLFQDTPLDWVTARCVMQWCSPVTQDTGRPIRWRLTISTDAGWRTIIQK